MHWALEGQLKESFIMFIAKTHERNHDAVDRLLLVGHVLLLYICFSLFESRQATTLLSRDMEAGLVGSRHWLD